MSIEANTEAVLLTLPRELRDGIYGYLVLDQHVLASRPKPTTYPEQFKNAKEEVYFDSRIYLPVRPATNVLGICRQIRAEYLEYVNHFLNSLSKPMPVSKPKPAVVDESSDSDGDEVKAKEEIAERARDDGSIRITVELMRAVGGGFGLYVPPRNRPSPRFIAIAPMLGEVRKIKINVWAGWDWWFGPPKVRRRVQTGARTRFKRLTPDQQDVPISNGEEEKDIAQDEPKKPDPLAVAITALLDYLPSVEEVNVDVMMHGYLYCNMDLPENRWEHVQGWLETPVWFENGRTMKKISRKMVTVDTSQDPIRDAVFYHKTETWEALAHGEHKNVVHVAEGHRVISEEQFFEEALAEIAFTHEYDRFE